MGRPHPKNAHRETVVSSQTTCLSSVTWKDLGARKLTNAGTSTLSLTTHNYCSKVKVRGSSQLPTFLLQDDRHHIWVITGDGHVQGCLQIDAVHGAGQGRGLLWQRRSFLRLQVRVGTLLQELCREVGQAMPTGCVQRGLSLSRGKRPTSEHVQEGSSRPRALTTACVLTPGSPGQSQPLAHPVTS